MPVNPVNFCVLPHILILLLRFSAPSYEAVSRNKLIDKPG